MTPVEDPGAWVLSNDVPGSRGWPRTMAPGREPDVPEHDPSRSPDEAVEAVCRGVVALVRERLMRPGERLGSEREIAALLGVSRGLLRRGLEVLQEEGVVQRWLGRTGGVTVNDARVQRSLNMVEGVPETVLRQGLALSTRVVAATTGEAAQDEARALRLPPGAPVLRIERVRSVEGAPWSLDLSVLPAALFPGLLQVDLRDSLYGIMARGFGVTIDEAEETLSVVGADRRRAELLSIDPGAPVLEVWRVATDPEGVPVEFAHDLVRADRTRVRTQRTGTNWKRAVRRGP